MGAHLHNHFATPYETACAFIRLHDIVATLHKAGIEPSESLRQELRAYRDQLDAVLPTRRDIYPTAEQWERLVRRRLTAAA
jgi:hypothetical protein